MKKQTKKLNLNKITVSNLEVKSIKGGEAQSVSKVIRTLQGFSFFAICVG